MGFRQNLRLAWVAYSFPAWEMLRIQCLWYYLCSDHLTNYVLLSINTVSFTLVKLKESAWLEIAKLLDDNWLLSLYSIFFLLSFLLVILCTLHSRKFSEKYFFLFLKVRFQKPQEQCHSVYRISFQFKYFDKELDRLLCLD